MARHVISRPGLELVGGIDIDPAKVDADVGQVIGLDRALGIPVFERLSDALAGAEADVALHTAGSYFDLFYDQIIELVDASLDVVSTAEELSYPWHSHSDRAQQIDALAKEKGVTVLATGVNPGFLMDTLPLTLTAICQRVDRIEVTRSINASVRRGPFQAKIGAGMTVADFEAKMAEGRMGHVGLEQSMAMLFDTLGRTMVDYESAVEPVIAAGPLTTDYFQVAPGRVRGLKQVARGYVREGEFATLTFVAALDAEQDADTVVISGVPKLSLTLLGAHGDLATIAIVVNAIHAVQKASPGLVTMRDLPPVVAYPPAAAHT
jgi:4-hydroxy-tetrahydrodipicolinate reductase